MSSMDAGSRNNAFASGHLFLPIILFSLFSACTCRAAQPLQWVCGNANTTQKAAQLDKNVFAMLNNLANASLEAAAFNTSVVGTGDNIVYGLLQCMGDASAHRCRKCSVEAKAALEENCPKKFRGMVWFDDCFMRFQNSNFVGRLDTQYSTALYNAKNASNQNTFRNSVMQCLTDLSNKATQLSAIERYSAGACTLSDSNITIYGIAQCWRDISIGDCRTCLNDSTDFIYKTLGWSVGARRITANCMVRYENYSFFNNQSSVSFVLPPPYSPAATPHPSARPPSSANSEERSPAPSQPYSKSHDKAPAYSKASPSFVCQRFPTLMSFLVFLLSTLMPF